MSTIIAKTAITVGDIQDLLNLGLVTRETKLSVVTDWAPVDVIGLQSNAESCPEQLFLSAPVMENIRAWSYGQHGATLRGEFAGATGDDVMRHIESSHEQA